MALTFTITDGDLRDACGVTATHPSAARFALLRGAGEALIKKHLAGVTVVDANVLNLALSRVVGYWLDSPPGTINEEAIGPLRKRLSLQRQNAIKHSGAGFLLSPYKTIGIGVC